MKKSKGIIAIAAAMLISGSAAYAQEGVHPPAPAGLDVHFGFPGIRGLNDLLVKKGIVTQEELEAQDKKHSFNLSGYIQFQGTVIENDNENGADGKQLADEDGFRIRRAKLAAFGNAYEHVKFKLEMELTGTSKKLEDAWIEDDRLPYFIGKVGQFKAPFGREYLTSATETLTIERSEVTNQITPGRDIGIMFNGKVVDSNLHYYVGIFNGAERKTATSYSVGSYNGAAQNKTSNDNDNLMYVGRLVSKPVEWAEIGVNILSSKDDETGGNSVERTSYGIDFQLKNKERG